MEDMSGAWRTESTTLCRPPRGAPLVAPTRRRAARAPRARGGGNRPQNLAASAAAAASFSESSTVSMEPRCSRIAMVSMAPGWELGGSARLPWRMLALAPAGSPTDDDESVASPEKRKGSCYQQDDNPRSGKRMRYSGNVVAYTYPYANARRCPCCLLVFCLSILLEKPSQTHL
uniref:Uncharacterized protein n=1 Tax=Oryza punctata TaxID=4537 RepID=A0A0E0M385_ORYPU